MTLAGKTAIVTGASSGIGEAVASGLARGGCNVVLAARRADRLGTLAGRLGKRALAVPTDVTDPAACAALVGRAVEGFGAVDLLVNNAGLGVYAPIAEADPEDWRRMFDVNVLGALFCTRAAVRPMLRRGSGHIIFISSVSGRRVPGGGSTVYAATKHAISAITEGLRMELVGRDIRVTSVEPGLVRTEFPESSYPSAEQFYAEKGYAPLEAEDVAEAVLYAASQPGHTNVNQILLRPIEQSS